MSATDKRNANASPLAYLIAALLAAAAGFAAIYFGFAPGEGWHPESSQPSASSGSASEGHGSLAGLNQGPMAAFVIKAPPETMPEVSLADASGGTKKLADFKGRVVLLNIWATWCLPCREEMPELDKLEGELGGKEFQVVAVNIDRGGSDKAAKFLADTGAKHLQLYSDPTGKLFSAVKAVGMPTSLLLDREGREIGRLVGPANWASPQAEALIKAAIGAKAAASG